MEFYIPIRCYQGVAKGLSRRCQAVVKGVPRCYRDVNRAAKGQSVLIEVRDQIVSQFSALIFVTRVTTPYGVHCTVTVYSVRRILYNVHGTVYSVQCTAYIIHCTR